MSGNKYPRRDATERFFFFLTLVIFYLIPIFYLKPIISVNAPLLLTAFLALVLIPALWVRLSVEKALRNKPKKNNLSQHSAEIEGKIFSSLLSTFVLYSVAISVGVVMFLLYPVPSWVKLAIFAFFLASATLSVLSYFRLHKRLKEIFM